MQQHTPMIQQYLEIKASNSDSILFFRLGDFYEMFFEDAQIAARLLEITLTARDGGQAGKIPMCGVPYHAADTYIARLIKAGRKVAICEQVENPANAKGLVRREVVRTITPATYHDTPPDSNNYIVCWLEGEQESILAAVDYTTGSVLVRSFQGDRLYEQAADELLRLCPKEIILDIKSIPEPVHAALSRTQAAWRQAFGLPTAEASAVMHSLWGQEKLSAIAKEALGEIISYFLALKVGGFGHLTAPVVTLRGEGMALDVSTRRNLEVTASLRNGEREGSLLWALDYTATAMGARLIKQWVEQPLLDVGLINARLTAVEELHANNLWRAQLREALSNVSDIERLLSKVTNQTANPRDLLALAKSLQAVAYIKILMQNSVAPLLAEIYSDLCPQEELVQVLLSALDESPPLSYRDGRVIKDGFHSEVDRLRTISRDTKTLLATFEAKERELSGIKSLKIGFNRVFGYYIEVTNSNLAQVPARFHRKQTLANGERYITEELKELENTILTAEERLITLEEELFLGLRENAAGKSSNIVVVARRIAITDVLQSFAEAAGRHQFHKPELNTGKTIVIVGGRHPVVERTVGRHAFVPNDTYLQQGELAILTGPNMAGKSTYMRQVALIVLMAQVGSFVSADKAEIGYVDRIFTRVGAADDLYGGHSTFMVEMLETSVALAEATDRSLLLFDEVGRGTSTYDGMAIAQAIMEFIHDQVRARTIFSTHYHELTWLSASLIRCRNYVVATLESGKEVVFLHRVQPGKANKSYGIHVARLAGLPRQVINRALAVLKEHETRQHTPYQQTNFLQAVAESSVAQEYDERTVAALDLYDALQQLAPEALTPLQALNLLHELRERTLRKGDKTEN